VGALEASAPHLFSRGDWTKGVHAELLAVLQAPPPPPHETTYHLPRPSRAHPPPTSLLPTRRGAPQAHRSYRCGSVRDLLRAVRNCDHLQEMPAEVQRLLLPRPAGIAAYFLPRFPSLFWTLFTLVQQHWRDKRVFEPFLAWQVIHRHATPQQPQTLTPPSLQAGLF
jgi:hypothetical protein